MTAKFHGRHRRRYIFLSSFLWKIIFPIFHSTDFYRFRFSRGTHIVDKKRENRLVHTQCSRPSSADPLPPASKLLIRIMFKDGKIIITELRTLALSSTRMNLKTFEALSEKFTTLVRNIRHLSCLFSPPLCLHFIEHTRDSRHVEWDKSVLMLMAMLYVFKWQICIISRHSIHPSSPIHIHLCASYVELISLSMHVYILIAGRMESKRRISGR